MAHCPAWVERQWEPREAMLGSGTLLEQSSPVFEAGGGGGCWLDGGVCVCQQRIAQQPTDDTYTGATRRQSRQSRVRLVTEGTPIYFLPVRTNRKAMVCGESGHW
jgi:hypothetical protein